MRVISVRLKTKLKVSGPRRYFSLSYSEDADSTLSPSREYRKGSGYRICRTREGELTLNPETGTATRSLSPPSSVGSNSA